ncbi:MAG: MarR family transcriptional regulator [Acidilobaceae archaeon]
MAIDERDIEILDYLELEGPVTLSTLAYKLGKAKSFMWRRIDKLRSLGLINVKKVGGVSIIYRVYDKPAPGVIKIGLLRASEYPYILEFARMLKDMFSSIKIIVYDEAFRLGLDLASNKVQLGMAPVSTLILAHRISSGRVHIVGGGSGGGAYILESKGGGLGHATTMASTMELCAEMHKLEPPRVYKSSGIDILESTLRGETRYGVVWEPYAAIAKTKGLKADPCNTPICCVLGANKSIEASFRHISRLLSKAISESKAKIDNINAYANIIGLEKVIVAKTIESYTFYEDIPRDLIVNIWGSIKASIVPDISLNQVFRED